MWTRLFLLWMFGQDQLKMSPKQQKTKSHSPNKFWKCWRCHFAQFCISCPHLEFLASRCRGTRSPQLIWHMSGSIRKHQQWSSWATHKTVLRFWTAQSHFDGASEIFFLRFFSLYFSSLVLLLIKIQEKYVDPIWSVMDPSILPGYFIPALSKAWTNRSPDLLCW